MVEIRPNIFVRKSKTEEDFYDICSVPEGYEIPGYPTPEDILFSVGDITISKDVIETILWETCNQLFFSGKGNTPEMEKAREDYKSYTGNEYTSKQFYKRSD